jgi:hypothetical protein
MPIGGGTTTTICSAPAEHGAAWLSDDVIVFSDGSSLQRVSVHDGRPVFIAMPDTSKGETHYESPVALPGGNAVMFSIRTNSPGEHRVAVLPLNNGKWTPLVSGADQPRFIAPGFVVVNRSGTLEVARFDTARLAVNGSFRRLGEGASMAGAPSIGGGEAVVSYDVAAAGRSLVYVKAHSAEEPRGVYSLDLHGNATLLSLDKKLYADAALSPDESKIAVDVDQDSNTNEIWVLDLATKAWNHLTSGHSDWQPAWRDEHTLIFGRARRVSEKEFYFDMFASSLSGKMTPMLASFPFLVGSFAVARDGSAAVFESQSGTAGTDTDLWTQALGRDGKASDQQAKPLVATSANERVIPCGFSPDSRWLAYSSDASGRREIYVTDFPAGSAPHVITHEGPNAGACWSKDGNQIFYWHGNTVMAVAVRAGEPTETPHALFDSPVTFVWGYDVANDGRTFYVPGYKASRTSPIVFVSDITADLPLGTGAR